MKKVLLNMLPVFALALSAFAQDGTAVKSSKANTETVGVSITGGVDFDWVQRDAALNLVRDSLVGDGSPRTENVIHGHYRVGIDADLSEKVKIRVSLENPRFASDPAGIGPFTSNNADVLGDSNDFVINTARAPLFREANITLSEVLDPSVSVTAGILMPSFGYSGDGQSLFFDPAHSASITNNLTNSPQPSLDTAREELVPAGMVVNFQRDALGLTVAMLPAILTSRGFGGGNESDGDEGAYVVDVSYSLESQGLGKGSRVGGLICLSDMPTTGISMYTIGAGVHLVDIGSPGLNVFGEFYTNTGTAFEVNDVEVDAKGTAFEVGVHYSFAHESNPWIQAKITRLSGDGDTTDTDEENFLSYESKRDLMIIEDPFYGLDWDSNLQAIKIKGGASFSVGQGKNNLSLMATIGLCTTVEDIGAAPNEEDALGTEIDVVAKYAFSKQVTISAGAAILTGSDILEQLGGAPAVDAADDGSMLYTVGIEGNF